MKKSNILLMATAILFISCAKENVRHADASQLVTVNATIVSPENVDTKTDYTINELTNKAVFCWKGTEQIGRFTHNGSQGWQTIYTSTTSADSQETSLTFAGAEVTDDTGFAIYPQKDAANQAGLNWYANPLYFHLNEAITYNKTAQLSNLVPMLGKMVAGEYVFKPITGILAISINHMPPSANKVTISSNNHYLSFGFRNSNSGVGYADELEAIYTGGLRLDNYRAGAKKTKTFTFDAGLDVNTTYVFYFPIPSGTLNDGTTDELTVTVYNGTTALYTKTTSTGITIENGKITRLTTITLPEVAQVAAGGSATSIQAKISQKTPGVAYVKFYAAADEAAAIAGVGANGTQVNTLNTLTAVNGNFGDSGQYYIAYQGYSSGDSEITTVAGTIPVYYLNGTDEANYVGTYLISSSSSASTSLNTNARKTLKLYAASDCTKGNLQVGPGVGSGDAYKDVLFGNQCIANMIYGVLQGSTLTLEKSAENNTYFFSNGVGTTNYFYFGQRADSGVGSTVGDFADAVFAASTSPSVTLTNAAYLHLYYHAGSSTGTQTEWIYVQNAVYTRQ